MDNEKKIESAKEEAIKNLVGIIEPNKLGYKYYLNKEIKRILDEQGIDWEAPNDDPPSSNYI